MYIKNISYVICNYICSLINMFQLSCEHGENALPSILCSIEAFLCLQYSNLNSQQSVTSQAIDLISVYILNSFLQSILATKDRKNKAYSVLSFCRLVDDEHDKAKRTKLVSDITTIHVVKFGILKLAYKNNLKCKVLKAFEHVCNSTLNTRNFPCINTGSLI